MFPDTSKKPTSNLWENGIDIFALASSPLFLELEARFLIAVTCLYIAARAFYYCALSSNVCVTAIRRWRLRRHK